MMRVDASSSSRIPRRNWLFIGLAGALVLAGLVLWAGWPSGDAAAPRERQYRDLTACLLTDERGVEADPARAAWAGMQSASVATLVRVQYLPVLGAQTPENAVTFFNTLAVQNCALIVAAGDAPVRAVLAGKGQFPGIRYVLVGNATADGSVTVVPAAPPEVVTSTVDSVLTELARDSP